VGTIEVILTSAFSILIIIITLYFIVKILLLAYKRKEITFRKLIFLSTTFIFIGLVVASTLPFGYEKIMNYIY